MMHHSRRIKSRVNMTTPKIHATLLNIERNADTKFVSDLALRVRELEAVTDVENKSVVHHVNELRTIIENMQQQIDDLKRPIDGCVP